ncbi:DUF3307 domain-containing protein [Myroides odoratimimus]|uniref:DUF3307 domain-containing protein n=1 Tax=Myroides odoratimimus TaxID=76832 RepID=UPI002DB5E947|nr:DUF3307 domain-containing protein [Myroides odoratimimus]MEC4052079.1 DUF3307 domain-containing protein [Myroides odoratimimus]
MLDLIIKVVLAHLVGDFVLQTNKMVADINKKGIRSKALLYHTAIHLVLLLAVTGFEAKYILGVWMLVLIHLLIDIYTKTSLSKKLSSISVLLIDQGLHAISIALFVYYYYPFEIDWALVMGKNALALYSALILLVYASPIIIKKIIERFDFTVPNNGLENAGKYIGILERLFIFLFVVLQRWEGIGFLLAAKSIFRFGDLKANKDIKLTEYILIGTLISFGLGIAIALLYNLVVSL